MCMRKTASVVLLLGLCAMVPAPWGKEAGAARIKELAGMVGARSNQLVGYGLVVGLDGTGDKKDSRIMILSMMSMLQKMGLTLDAKDIKVENVAAVMVTADLPPFAKQGSRIDALVSSMGDAQNLQGGTLLYTPLMGADGNIYAVAQGAVSTGGFSASGAGTKVQKNFPTVGRVVSGVLIERDVQAQLTENGAVTFALHQPDFTTACRVADAINQTMRDTLASPKDGGTVHVVVPPLYKERLVEFMTTLESIEVKPDRVAKIILNERTGTVVMGDNVRISTVALAHGNLSIEIKEQPQVSQPMPFSNGQTTVTPDTQITVKETKSPIFLMEAGVSIGDLVKALNALGLTPRDLMAILQAIKAAGALEAELEII